MGTVIPYSHEQILLLAEERIANPIGDLDKRPTVYEYHVGSWACTMLSRHLGPGFLLTPEMFNRQSNKKPDFTIERYDENAYNKTRLHAVYEIKKHGGDYLEKALNQLVNAINLTGDETGDLEIFLIVQRGLEIGFFEFSSMFHGDLDHLNIEHFRGCIPLLHDNRHMIRGNEPSHRSIIDMSQNIPQDVVRLLNRETETTGNNMPQHKKDLLDEADLLQTPCIFNLTKHRKEINLLFHHIATTKPRKVYM